MPSPACSLVARPFIPLTLVLALTLLPGSGRGQAAMPEGTGHALGDAEYVATVSSYVHGQIEEAVGEAARWRPADVAAAAERVPISDARLLAGAALLHVDAARRLEREAARAHRAGAYTVAMRLAGEEGAALDQGVRRDTALVVATALHAVLDTAGVELLLARAIKLWPDDADLLVARGSLSETYVSMGPPARSRSLEEQDVRAAARRAAADYARALALSPGHVEARIRLGRVQLQLGRPTAAHQTLERARKEAPPGSPLAYFATLLLGSAHEDLGRPADAEACYRAALEQYPDAQVPFLALAHLRHRAGRVTAAQQQVRAMASRAEATIHDPWWVYDYGQLWSLDERAASLRRRIAS